MIKKAILAILIIGSIATVVFIGVLSITSGSRDAARSFVMDATAGNYEAARAVMHPELAREFPVERMDEIFGTARPYSDISFSSIHAQNSRTTIGGTARTADGCESQVDFTLLSSEIIAFNITPLCRQD